MCTRPQAILKRTEGENCTLRSAELGSSLLVLSPGVATEFLPSPCKQDWRKQKVVAKWSENRGIETANSNNHEVGEQPSRIPSQLASKVGDDNIHLILEVEVEAIATKRCVAPPG